MSGRSPDKFGIHSEEHLRGTSDNPAHGETHPNVSDGGGWAVDFNLNPEQTAIITELADKREYDELRDSLLEYGVALKEVEEMIDDLKRDDEQAKIAA